MLTVFLKPDLPNCHCFSLPLSSALIVEWLFQGLVLGDILNKHPGVLVNTAVFAVMKCHKYFS
jgi:hypothetical protein